MQSIAVRLSWWRMIPLWRSPHWVSAWRVRGTSVPLLMPGVQGIDLSGDMPAHSACDWLQLPFLRNPCQHLHRIAVAVLNKYSRVFSVLTYPLCCQLQSGDQCKPLGNFKLLL